jgi:hypothetical protein
MLVESNIHADESNEVSSVIVEGEGTFKDGYP